MTIQEIFSKINEHMLQGIMFHAQMANYYDFLGLDGYKRCHEYHFLEEILSYRSLNRYYINHSSHLIPDTPVENESVIPNSWYEHSREDVDMNTKRNAIKSGLVKWTDWEKKTKELYEHMYQEALSVGEVASSYKILCLVKDVDHELKNAQRYLISKESVGYDMTIIIEEQKPKHDKYKEKMCKLLRDHHES